MTAPTSVLLSSCCFFPLLICFSLSPTHLYSIFSPAWSRFTHVSPTKLTIPVTVKISHQITSMPRQPTKRKEFICQGFSNFSNVSFLSFLSPPFQPSPLHPWTNPSSKSPLPPLTPLPSSSPPITPSPQPFNPSRPIPALWPSVTFSLSPFFPFLPPHFSCLSFSKSLPFQKKPCDTVPRRPKAKKHCGKTKTICHEVKKSKS